MKSVRSFVEGPRWANFESALKNYAWVAGLDIKTNVEKGLFRETVRFEVSGEDKAIDQFFKDIHYSVGEWNKTL
jgi:hypothetical protein